MKKLNKKGFTLIELLAVIVILAIILVIAVPSVLGIQGNAKLGVAKDEAILALKAYETCVSSVNTVSGTSNKCATATSGVYQGLSDFFDNYTGVKTITESTGDYTKLTAFSYKSTNGYCVTFSNTTAASINDIKNKIGAFDKSESAVSGSTSGVTDTTTNITIKKGNC